MYRIDHYLGKELIENLTVGDFDAKTLCQGIFVSTRMLLQYRNSDQVDAAHLLSVMGVKRLYMVVLLCSQTYGTQTAFWHTAQ